MIFLVFSVGLVLVRRLRHGQGDDHFDPGDHGEGVGEVAEGDRGAGVLQNQAVIFTAEEAGDSGDTPDDNDHSRDNLGLEANFDAVGMKPAENYSKVTFREADPILEKYPSDKYSTGRTRVKLNPLYHNYS